MFPFFFEGMLRKILSFIVCGWFYWLMLWLHLTRMTLRYCFLNLVTLFLLFARIVAVPAVKQLLRVRLSISSCFRLASVLSELTRDNLVWCVCVCLAGRYWRHDCSAWCHSRSLQTSLIAIGANGSDDGAVIYLHEPTARYVNYWSKTNTWYAVF